jgi:hypothetical protein
MPVVLATWKVEIWRIVIQRVQETPISTRNLGVGHLSTQLFRKHKEEDCNEVGSGINVRTYLKNNQRNKGFSHGSSG